jgi:hypothetical protein
MKRLREYIARTEIDPATVRYAGWIHPPDLVVSVDYPLALWEAITEWLKDTKAVSINNIYNSVG